MTCVDVCMTIYPTCPERVRYMTDTLDALDRKLTGAELRFFCSSESPDDGEFFDGPLEWLCESRGITLSFRDGPPDVAGNMNAALSMGSADLILMIQDDWLLTKPLDLGPSIRFLAEHPEFSAIRYQYPPSLRTNNEIDGFRIVDMRQTWPFLDSPSLRRRSMLADYGEYVVGLRHRAAEHRYGRLLADCGVKIAAYPRSVFYHAGMVSFV